MSERMSVGEIVELTHDVRQQLHAQADQHAQLEPGAAFGPGDKVRAVERKIQEMNLGFLFLKTL